MEMFELANYGVAIFSVGALVFCIKEFLKFMTNQEASFKDTIDNHLNSSKEIASEQLKSAQSLSKTVEELLTYLRYQNGRNKSKDK